MKVEDTYTIKWTETALKALKRVRKDDAVKVIDVERLADDPFKYVKKLGGIHFIH